MAVANLTQMKTFFSALVAFSVVAVGGAAPLRAETKDASPSPSIAAPTASALRPIPFSAKIYVVDKPSKTFSTQSAKEKKIRVFVVLPQTKITKANGKAGIFEDLKPGEEVRGIVLKKGEGHFDVESLTIGAKEEPSATPAASASPVHKKKSSE